ncbi:T-cell leukemia translocation-altered gene protein homolog isoform X3 [Branchiostoma lanceolatum]|uniref:T-cell leukemia translocation-altered gene protein homolog isoform X3 n=1 Tax=Branchiostoma lanceolatum TaxID=7740 RepID=UPI00345491AE
MAKTGRVWIGIRRTMLAAVCLEVLTSMLFGADASRLKHPILMAARSVLSLLQQAWNSDDYQVQLCMVALGWILLNILLILLAWRRHGSSISDMFRRQGTSASCKGRLSPVFNKRPTWQDKSHLNGTNFNSSTGLPNGNGLPNGSHLPNGRLRTVSEKSHQS